MSPVMTDYILSITIPPEVIIATVNTRASEPINSARVYSGWVPATQLSRSGKLSNAPPVIVATEKFLRSLACDLLGKFMKRLGFAKSWIDKFLGPHVQKLSWSLQALDSSVGNPASWLHGCEFADSLKLVWSNEHDRSSKVLTIKSCLFRSQYAPSSSPDWDASLWRPARRAADRVIDPFLWLQSVPRSNHVLCASDSHSWQWNSSPLRCTLLESHSGHWLLESSSLISWIVIPVSPSVSSIRSTSCPWLQNAYVFSFTIADQCVSNTSDKSPTYTVSTFCSSSHSQICLTAAFRLWLCFRVRLSCSKRAICPEYRWNRLNSGRAWYTLVSPVLVTMASVLFAPTSMAAARLVFSCSCGRVYE